MSLTDWPVPPPSMWACEQCAELLWLFAPARTADEADPCQDHVARLQVTLSRHVVEDHPGDVPPPHTDSCAHCEHYARQTDARDAALGRAPSAGAVGPQTPRPREGAGPRLRPEAPSTTGGHRDPHIRPHHSHPHPGPGTRDPQELLNATAPHVTELTVNVFDSGMTLWDREIALLLRDHTMVRDMAERILANAVMYVMGSIENPDVHLGVGKLVDIGVHQLILDTPVWWGICRLYNGGRFKHHAPFIERRDDGLCLRTGDFLKSQGWDIDEELWAIDGANCSPCDNKVPDSH